VVSGNPVAFVRVPELGVPSAPPLTTNAPAVPTLIPSAVATPVPSPERPVEIGRPVALVSVTLVGVPKTGVTSVGLVDITTLPVPVMALLTRFLEPSVKIACDAVKAELFSPPTDSLVPSNVRLADPTTNPLTLYRT